MAKKKNSYEGSAKKKSALAGITSPLETKGNLKNTAIETAKDLVVGVVGGGVAGAALGKFSILVGTALNGFGHYTKNRLLSLLGFGMMASSAYKATDENISGNQSQDVLEGAKERVLSYKDSLLNKLFLDKFFNKASSSEGTQGVGEVKYFNSSNEKVIDLSELDKIERQIAASGSQFANQQETSGISGINGFDPEERIY